MDLSHGGAHLAETCEPPGTDGIDIDVLEVLDVLVEFGQGRLLRRPVL